jgi:carbon-monoxide dehydrogenase medium subunit
VRRHGDFALAAVAATLTLSGSEIVQARIALTGVSPTTLRAAEAESVLVGREFDEKLSRRAIEAVREVISPETDLHASADYRPLATDDDIHKGLSGNLCRCTGYEHIVKAIRAVVKPGEK